MKNVSKPYDVIIVGGGPAGLSAAIYAGRAGLSVLVVERAAFGGAIFQTAEIANYPGGQQSESGAEFSARLEAHAWSFGAEKALGAVTAVKLEGAVKEIAVGDVVYRTHSVIIATGSVPAKLGIPGEAEFTGLGVSYCAVCDGPFFSGLDVFVVGGGDSAIEESLHLAKIARKVTVIHRRDAFRAAKQLVERAKSAENISFMLDTIVTGIGGDGFLARVEAENVKTGERFAISANEGENFGFFIFAGMRPSSELFDGLEMKDGYIVTDDDMRTSIPGVFAAGDVRAKRLRQVVTATADGAIAAIQAEKYIGEKAFPDG